MKDKCVVFLDNNARVYVGPQALDIHTTQPQSLLNPDLSLVAGVVPQYWKRDGDKVVAMNDLEKQIRDHMINKNGIQTKLNEVVNKKLSLMDVLYILISPFIYLYRKLKIKSTPIIDNSELIELKSDYDKLKIEFYEIKEHHDSLIELLEISQAYLYNPSPDNSSKAQNAFNEYYRKNQ